MDQKWNLLFVCSRNQWRSPTAERIFRDSEDFNVRSAGTSASAQRRITAGDLDWADIVFVMEAHHRDILHERYGRQARDADIRILGIVDEYQFMDPELIVELKSRVDALLAERP